MKSNVVATLVAVLLVASASVAQAAWVWVVEEDAAATTTCAPGFFLAALEAEEDDDDGDDEGERIFACLPTGPATAAEDGPADGLPLEGPRFN